MPESAVSIHIASTVFSVVKDSLRRTGWQCEPVIPILWSRSRALLAERLTSRFGVSAICHKVTPNLQKLQRWQRSA